MKSMKSVRRSLLAAVAAGAMLFAAACSSGTPTATTPTDPTGAPTTALEKVAICTGAQPDYAPIYVAKELGMWEKYGIDLELDICPTSPIAIAAIMNDERQASNNSVTGVSAAIGNGIPAKVIFAVTYQPQEGNTAILVPKDSDIQTYADLEGKTLGTITVQGLFHLGLAQAMKDQGADPSKMRVVGSAPLDLGPLLTSGQVDAIMIQDANLTLILDQIGADTVRNIGNPFGSISWGENLVIGAMTASVRQLREKPELYQKLREGWLEAIELTKANPDIEKKVIAEYTGFEPSLIERVTWGEYATDLPEKSTTEMLAALLEFGFVRSVSSFEDIYWDGN